MTNFEFFGEPYPQTGLSEMDPVMREQIVMLASDGADLAELEEIFGPENVRLAATNHIELTDLIEQAGGGADAA